MRLSILRFPLAVALFLALTSCFTGVDSTPKITAKDVRREQAASTAPEDTFLASVRGQAPRDWRPGKRFIVTDPKIELIFSVPAASDGRSLAAGDVVQFAGFAPVADIDGTTDTQVMLRSADGQTRPYRVDRSPKELEQAAGLDVPFTIEESLVEAARRKISALKGPVYVVTRNWRDRSDQAVEGRKFVPVRVDSVAAGNAVYPLRVDFTDDTGRAGSVFLATATQGPRSWAATFTFTDPRKRYGQVREQFWPAIIAGRTARDMTREEVRLSLGAPASVDRAVTYAGIREVWSYENGQYLVFMDGVLQ